MTEYTYKEIVDAANIIKNNVETKYQLGANTRWSYFFAKQIIKPKTNVTRFSFTEAPSSTGDNISRQIVKKDYTDMATRLVKYVDNNKKLPNYITIANLKMKVNDYCYMFARILAYYDKNKAWPNYATVDSTAFTPQTKKKYGHATKSGCDNMGQNNGYYCGCHSLQEVFRNLTGIVVKQSTIASWAGTTSSGTGHDGLNTAVAKFNKTYNKNLKVEWKNFSDLGWNGIANIVKSKNQDCVIHNLYRNQWGHYEVVNNVSSNITVQNSLGDKCSSGCYCGYIEYRSQSTFRSYISGISQKSVMVITNA